MEKTQTQTRAKNIHNFLKTEGSLYPREGLRLTQLTCETCNKKMIFEISIGSKFILVCRQWDCKSMTTESQINELVKKMETVN